MAQDSPAKPLLDLRDKLYSTASKFLEYDKPIGKKKDTQKADTSWHDGMVKQANDAFRKSAQKTISPTGSKPTTKKKATSKKRTVRK